MCGTLHPLEMRAFHLKIARLNMCTVMVETPIAWILSVGSCKDMKAFVDFSFENSSKMGVFSVNFVLKGANAIKIGVLIASKFK